MNALTALWVCSQVANLPAANNCHGQNKYAVSCANDFSVFQHHQSSHLLYEQPISWPVREKLNKGIVNEKSILLVAEAPHANHRTQQAPDCVFRVLGRGLRTYHF
jgi:hypothetical protein